MIKKLQKLVSWLNFFTDLADQILWVETEGGMNFAQESDIKMTT